MPPTLPRPTVQDGDTLDFDGLWKKAREAADASGLKGYQIAEAIERTPASVSLALNHAGSRYAGMQRLIIAALTPFQIEEERSVTYRVKSKA